MNFDKYISLIPEEFCAETGGTMEIPDDDDLFLESIESGINVKENSK